LGTITITGFIYGWLMWQHAHHYCAYFPTYCTKEESSQVLILWEYKLVLGAVR
jgi:hypothetical protein